MPVPRFLCCVESTSNEGRCLVTLDLLLLRKLTVLCDFLTGGFGESEGDDGGGAGAAGTMSV